MDDVKGKGRGNLAMDFATDQGKGKSEEDLRRAQASHTFRSNDAPNFFLLVSGLAGELLRGRFVVWVTEEALGARPTTST